MPIWTPDTGGLAEAIAAGVVSDAAIAYSAAQAAALWKLRESISEAQKREGASIKHDIAVPVAASRISSPRRCPPFWRWRPGPARHLRPYGRRQSAFQFQFAGCGDDPGFLAHWDEVQQTVHDIVKAFDGSISAEHGIGAIKRSSTAPLQKSHEELDAMRPLKQAYDPRVSSIRKLIPPVPRL